MKQTRQEKLDILNRIAKEDSKWIKDAQWRERNKWWIRPKQRIHLKYLRVKRWMCKIKQ